MQDERNMPLSEHLEELRGVLIRSLIAWTVGFVLCFCLRDYLFAILFAPASDDFCLWRGIEHLTAAIGSPLVFSPIPSHFISTELTAQFMTHLQVALWAGLVLAAPYIVLELYRFVAPALYEREKRYSIRLTMAAVVLFLCGVLINYFIIFPFAYRFLASYQVQEEVMNHITLSSYISNFLILSLMMGVMFELPIVSWFLAKMGLVNASRLKQYRKHAIVVILIVAAVITPTGDAFTLLIVSLPVYLLYELSILIVRLTKI